VTDFSNKLKEAGLKITLPRIKILKILEAHSDRHFSVEDIYKLLLEENEDIGIATIYRVLTQCEQAGLVKRLQFEEGPALFELGQDDHHDHFVCTSCGLVEEFHDSIIEKRQREIAAKAGFTVEDHSMVLYGLCAKCQRRTRK
jgi:Fur family ferric uptake transcriptional regulator